MIAKTDNAKKIILTIILLFSVNTFRSERIESTDGT